jgi:hypothetical protein
MEISSIGQFLFSTNDIFDRILCEYDENEIINRLNDELINTDIDSLKNYLIIFKCMEDKDNNIVMDYEKWENKIMSSDMEFGDIFDNIKRNKLFLLYIKESINFYKTKSKNSNADVNNHNIFSNDTIIDL